MNLSERIRALGREGIGTNEIAQRLGVRYQHAYTVLKNAGLISASPRSMSGGGVGGERQIPSVKKPVLTIEVLMAGGFSLSSRWRLSDAGELTLERSLPKQVGVYAFAKDDIVLYVGVATIGLAKRIYFYGRPGPTQVTNIRLNAMMKHELLAAPHLDIYTASPPDTEWRGLPIHGSVGLEMGLIKKFTLPWNVRSAKGA
ncbi:GIY-YIG nuclease family protein [Ancylobacter sp. G4_0304]|uniref:GIY-YIG nuclease family protein n=1 Tax=Ancylobacter sp. G4_0304 TaxID=3114289 RepID=UPI0039C6D8B6